MSTSKLLDNQAPVAANTSHSMESNRTSAAAAQSERVGMPFDLTFDNVKGKHQLKRKAVDERGLVRIKREPVSKPRGRVSKTLKLTLGGTTDISALLATKDLSAKPELKNSILIKGITSLQETIRDETSTMYGVKMEGWREEIIDSTRQSCEKALKEYELRKQLSELLNEYKSNKELKEESWSDATWCSNKWAGPVSTLVTCNNDLQIRVLGMQKLREMIDEKRADIISRAEKLQTEIKNLGVSFI